VSLKGKKLVQFNAVITLEVDSQELTDALLEQHVELMENLNQKFRDVTLTVEGQGSAKVVGFCSLDTEMCTKENIPGRYFDDPDLAYAVWETTELSSMPQEVEDDLRVLRSPEYLKRQE
jgi:hypothetical protein